MYYITGFFQLYNVNSIYLLYSSHSSDPDLLKWLLLEREHDKKLILYIRVN